MKFLLEVDLDGTDWDEGTTVQELERILRYWGGNLRHCEIEPGDGQPLYDSGHQEVGRWTVTSE
ncbi:hypothetical protein [Streptomyces sp. TG1A-60]|uniref:hypothetical protein n=1 Tax=unclassified Streptomyces TaxID=2593676 RepID=UPI003086910F|nr:hypothetical protein OG622_06350 [Streptomyces sp. NBC_01314]